MGDIKNVKINVVAKVGLGSKFQTIENVEPLDSSDKVSIEHKEGEVLLVDFWATWCPPCQAPMAHNQDMLAKRGEDWKGKVRIIGVSIDQDKAKLQGHVQNKQWTSVEHYFRAGSNCSTVYGVQGVPHVLIVDTQGTIVYKGHPAQRPNLEQDFDDLAAGKPITGKGAWSGESGGDESKEEDEEEGKFTEVDSAAINKEIDEFLPVNEAL